MNQQAEFVLGPGAFAGATWTQIGRNPAAALGDIAPNIGAVVALEKTAEKTPSKVFPTFLVLNSGTPPGPAYFVSRYAPVKIAPSANGVENTANPDGEARFKLKSDLLAALDTPLRVNSPYGRCGRAGRILRRHARTHVQPGCEFGLRGTRLRTAPATAPRDSETCAS